MNRSGLDARGVEQLAHHVVEPFGLGEDRLEEVVHLILGPVDVGLQQAGHRRLDPRQWGAQVVRDRGEQRGSQPVGLCHRLRRRRLHLELPRLEHSGELGGEDVEHVPVICSQPRPEQG